MKKTVVSFIMVFVMLIGLVPSGVLAAEDTPLTIKVTQNTDKDNATVVGVYKKPSNHYQQFDSYKVTFAGTEGGYDIYTCNNYPPAMLIVAAYIPGETTKVAKTISGGTTEVTLDLTKWNECKSSGEYADDMYTNLGDEGTLNLSTDAGNNTFDLDTFRVYQGLGSSAFVNDFLEPEFIFDVTGDSIKTERIGDEGRERLRITAAKPGVSVIKITYGALDFDYQGNRVKFGVIEPRNTYAVVVNVDGGKDFDTGINTVNGVQVRNDFDTFYFDKEKGGRNFTFTPAAGSTVRVHTPLNNKEWDDASGWIDGTQNGDSWTVPLTDGRNIIEIKNGDSVRYQLVKARGIEVSVENLSSPDEPKLAVGETARIQMVGIEAPVEKMAGLYNPGFTQAPYIRYTSGTDTVKSNNSRQYETLAQVFTVDFTLNDKNENHLTGQIQGGGGFWGVGLNLGAHRNVPVNGVGNSMSGGAPDMGELFFGALPEIELPVDEDRSATSAFTEDGWIIVDCGTGGTGKSDSLTQKLKDMVGGANLDQITKLKIVGTMNDWDWTDGGGLFSTTALNSSNDAGEKGRALLTNLEELDLSEVETTFPNAALRALMNLEKLRLPVDFKTTNVYPMNTLPKLSTITFGDDPYIEGVFDMRGFTGTVFPAATFYMINNYSTDIAAKKIIFPGNVSIGEKTFDGMSNLEEIVFNGDSLGAISAAKAFNAGIKETAVAYVPAGADTTALAPYFTNIKVISEYPGTGVDEAVVEALQSAVDAAKEKYTKNPGYSAYSWDVLQTAIARAEALLKDNVSLVTPESFTAVNTALEDAEKYLVVDKDALKESIREANGLAMSDYTEESWVPFSKALAAAKTVFYDKEAGLEAIQNALKELETAKGNLEEPLGDTYWLKAQIQKYADIKANDFSANSDYEALFEVLEGAKEVVAMERPTMKEVNAVEEDLTAALNKVAYIAELRDAVAAADALNESDYTAEAWAKMEAALTEAKFVLADADTTQNAVDNELKALNKATTALANDKAVKSVSDLINGIGTVTRDSGKDIDAARVAYDKLSNAQKELVSNYDVLTAAEKTYADLTTKPEVKLPFEDLNAGAWYMDSIHYVYANDIMNGITVITFEPNSTLTRGMYVTMLYRLEGEPEVNGKVAYSDVEENAWFAKAVIWGTENGIIEGYDGKFNPDGSITREQMAAMMYRYAEYKGSDVSATASFDQFVDGETVSDWSKEEMGWAVASGLLKGLDTGKLEPQGNATRAQAATVFQRFMETIVK